VLAFHEVDYDRTHSIGYLTSVLDHRGIDLPPRREQIEELTPWAVAARYEDRIEEVLDRDVARELVSDVREWSDSALDKPE
jgi:HEPN domain-containing protein